MSQAARQKKKNSHEGLHQSDATAEHHRKEMHVRVHVGMDVLSVCTPGRARPEAVHPTAWCRSWIIEMRKTLQPEILRDQLFSPER